MLKDHEARIEWRLRETGQFLNWGWQSGALCHLSDTLSGMAREDPHWLVPVWCCTGTRKVLACSRKGHSRPAGLWEQPRALLASLTKKPPCPHPPSPSFSSGRCQLTRFGLLPSYVVDGSSPKQPRKGGGRGSSLSPLTRAFAGPKPHAQTRPFTRPCVYCTRPRS